MDRDTQYNQEISSTIDQSGQCFSHNTIPDSHSTLRASEGSFFRWKIHTTLPCSQQASLSSSGIEKTSSFLTKFKSPTDSEEAVRVTTYHHYTMFDDFPQHWKSPKCIWQAMQHTHINATSCSGTCLVQNLSYRFCTTGQIKSCSLADQNWLPWSPLSSMNLIICKYF